MRDFQMIPVNDFVWCLKHPSYQSCTYLIREADRVYFIDTGMRRQGSDVLWALKRLGLSLAQVKAVLVTHWHIDHSASIGLFEGAGIPIYLSAEENALFPEKYNPLSGLIPEYGPFILLRGHVKGCVARPKSPRFVQQGQLLFDRFQVVFTPGHTSGHVSYFDIRTQTLFAGDALAVIRGDLYRMARFVTLDQTEALASMKRLLTLPAKYIAPGHREPLKEEVAKKTQKFLKALEATPWPFWG